MNDQDKTDLRRLIPAMVDLLGDVATGRRQAHEAKDEYLTTHTALRAILTRYGEPCLCPWRNIFEWQGTTASRPDWQEVLAQQALKARILCGLEKPPQWTIAEYLPEGATESPYRTDFVNGLEPHKRVILQTSIESELRHEGVGVTENDKHGHKWDCNAKPGFRTQVFMYKIRQGHALGEVVLRVFFITQPGFNLLLLHGYDKGADPDKAREERERDVACARRADWLARSS